MTKPALVLMSVLVALPLFAQTPPPPDPNAPPPTTPAPQEPAPTQPPPPPPPAEKPKSSMASRFFFGGGVGASFGTVDYVEVSPLIGFRVVPRFDVGFQPFYRWTNDGRYAQDITTNDYGASVFGRFRIVAGFFAEADYQFTSFEFPNGLGGTDRDTYDAFLAGGGYYFGMGGHVGFYTSVLYDFMYDDNDLHIPYDSPVRVQVGVTVGF
jgi:hypothetical protein